MEQISKKATRGNRFIDLTGKVFGRLTVIEIRYCDNRRHFSWLCRCECGNEVIVVGRCLRGGSTRSCGCLRRDSQHERHFRHGMKGSSVYVAWSSMRQRCLNPQHRSYNDYGGRGISVCREWESFEVFFSDMGERPSTKHTLERRDNMAGYSKDNCYWATRTEQGRNRRVNRILSLGGISLCVSEWAERLCISRDIIQQRLKKKLDIKNVLRPFRDRPVRVMRK